MADIFMFGILGGGARSSLVSRPRRMPPMPSLVKLKVRIIIVFRFRLDLKVPNSEGGVGFFAEIVIVGNKLLMSDLFRIWFLVNGRSH